VGGGGPEAAPEGVAVGSSSLSNLQAWPISALQAMINFIFATKIAIFATFFNFRHNVPNSPPYQNSPQCMIFATLLYRIRHTACSHVSEQFRSMFGLGAVNHGGPLKMA